MRLSAEQEASLLDGEVATRRQYARFAVEGRTKGRVIAVCDALILDISIGGSLIEHSHVVRPGTISSLDLDLLGKRVSVRCRVARSIVHRSEVQPDGERELIFHTGLEFLETSDETRGLIGEYIQSIVCDGRKPQQVLPAASDEPDAHGISEDAR
ncbi:MAG: PilZ domain-containing protein [Candidatus Methylomirabilales bacterium]